MMYKKTKGFSLAELLISLLIISIVLAAAIPTITKRRAHDPENVWNWTNKNNSAFFGAGHNQTAIIGYDMMPFSDLADADKVDKYFDIDSISSDITEFNFSTDGDKLVLVKRLRGIGENKTENMKNSHISFYNIEDRTGATSRDLIYAGRISSDQHNLAFGIATLQSLNAVEIGAHNNDDIGKGRGYNTALGHYALSFLKEGAFNTAVGESTLTYNFNAHRNTALGSYALNRVLGHDNTAIGANAGKYLDALEGREKDPADSSKENTLIGANTLSVGINGEDVEASGNTAVGSSACASIIGDGNICIGKDTAAKTNAAKDKLIPIEDNYGIYIGQDPGGAPLINGHSSYDDTEMGYDILSGTSSAGYDKELNINARYFRVKPFDASRPILQIMADSGSVDGYGSGPNQSKFGNFSFSFKDLYNDGALKMAMERFDHLNQDIINLKFYDTKQLNDNALNTNEETRPVAINSVLRITTPKKVPTRTLSPSTTTDNNILIQTYFENDAKKVVDYRLNLNGAISMQNNENVTSPMIKIEGTKYDTQTLNMYLADNATTPSSFLTMNRKDAEVNFYNLKKVGITSDDVAINSTKDYVEINESVVILDDDISFKNNVSGYGNNFKGIIAKIKTEIEDAKQMPYPSDARLKNISGDSTAGLKEINALEVKNYTYKKDEKKTPHVGVIAQQLQKVFPNSVFEDEDGYLKIRTEEIFYAMVNSIKELFAQIQDLTAKVVGLDKRITELEQENAMLKKQNAEFEKRLSKLEAKMAK